MDRTIDHDVVVSEVCQRTRPVDEDSQFGLTLIDTISPAGHRQTRRRHGSSGTLRIGARGLERTARGQRQGERAHTEDFEHGQGSADLLN